MIIMTENRKGMIAFACDRIVQVAEKKEDGKERAKYDPLLPGQKVVEKVNTIKPEAALRRLL
jgi:hypothetical protein